MESCSSICVGVFQRFLLDPLCYVHSFRRKSCVGAYKNEIDPEIAQIMKEVYHDSYHRFDHKTAKQANLVLKQVLIKPILKEILRVTYCRWGVEQLTEKLEEDFTEMKEVANKIQKLLDEQPKVLKLSDVLSVKVDLLTFFARQKGYLHVPRKAYIQIGDILEKNGFSSNEKDRLCGNRQKSISRRMNDSLILLGKAIKSLNAEAIVKVCFLFSSHRRSSRVRVIRGAFGTGSTVCEPINQPKRRVF